MSIIPTSLFFLRQLPTLSCRWEKHGRLGKSQCPLGSFDRKSMGNPLREGAGTRPQATKTKPTTKVETYGTNHAHLAHLPSAHQPIWWWHLSRQHPPIVFFGVGGTGGTGGTKYLVLPGECSSDTEFHPSAGLDQNYPRKKNRIGQSPHWKTGLIPGNTGGLQPVFVDNWERVVASRAHSTFRFFFLLRHRGGAWVDPIHICLLLGETRWQSGVNDSVALTSAKTQPNPTTIYELSNYIYMLLHPLYIYL